MLIFYMLIRGEAYPGMWLIFFLLFTFNKAAWPLKALLGHFLCVSLTSAQVLLKVSKPTHPVLSFQGVPLPEGVDLGVLEEPTLFCRD